MKKLFAALCCLMTFCAIIRAQNSDDYKKWEGYAGVSIAGLDPGESDKKGLNGFEASGIYNFGRYFGIKGDVSAGFGSSQTQFVSPPSNTITFDNHLRLWNFLGGVQIKDNSNQGRFKPFVHALIGVGHNQTRNDNFQCSGSCAAFPASTLNKTGLAGDFGGGLDIRVNNRFQIRVIQMDYNPVQGPFQTQHNLRLGAGIVF